MKPPLFALFALIASPVLAHAQKAEWNGHTYEAIWFPEERINSDRFPNGFTWAGTAAEAQDLSSDTLGGHIVTITNQDEYEIVLGLWREIIKNPRFEKTPYAPLGLIGAGDEFNVDFEGYQWITGEPFTFRRMLSQPLHEYCEMVMGGDENGIGAGGAKCADRNYYFYILEKEPLDSDKDGVSNQVENREGTDPNEPTSIPTASTMINLAVRLQTETHIDKTYQIQLSSDLRSWHNIGLKITGTGNPHSFFHLAGETAQFLRVLVVE